MSLIVRLYLIAIPAVVFIILGVILERKFKRTGDRSGLVGALVLMLVGFALCVTGLVMFKQCLDAGNACFS